jgi:hypothetical protein
LDVANDKMVMQPSLLGSLIDKRDNEYSSTEVNPNCKKPYCGNASKASSTTKTITASSSTNVLPLDIARES